MIIKHTNLICPHCGSCNTKTLSAKYDIKGCYSCDKNYRGEPTQNKFGFYNSLKYRRRKWK